MSRYDWPAVPAGEGGDDPAGRGRFNARRRTEFDAEGARIAASTPQSKSEHPGLRAPPSGRQHLWQPLGPQTVIGGQASGGPRISGRINALAVHPDGERLYAASANGGVWYSRDGGANWISLGGLASTDIAGIDRPAHRHACGAIEAVFGDTEADDVVYVGTGEVTHPFSVLSSVWVSGQPGRPLAGVGILRAEHPATSGLANPWVREARNLAGNGVYRIVVEPGGNTVIAATLTGLYQRPAAPGLDVDWVRPLGTPFNTLDSECTDALWTVGDADSTRPARLWVWVERGPNGGLWARDSGQVDFKRIATAGATERRAALAASTPPDQIWVFNDRPNGTLPLLYRVSAAGNATPVATRVTVGVPDVLKTQGFYDIAIAVDPAHPDRVALGGSYLATTTPDGATIDIDAAIVVADVAHNVGTLTYGHPPNPFTMIGIGVHSDVHALAYSNGGGRLWTGCDAGVFRSDHPTQTAGFHSRNNGLDVIEANYVAVHPRCEGHVLAGLQDNGVVQRQSNGVWKVVELGDGGSVLFEPLRGDRWLSQYVRGEWRPSDGSFTRRAMLTRGGSFAKGESDNSAFYSMGATIAHRRGAPAPTDPNIGQLVVGTTRVWYSEDFGVSWKTLPTGTDPLPANSSQDSFGEAITVCRWQSPDIAWVLGEGRLMRYARVPGSDNGGGPGSWSRETVIRKGVKNKKDATSADGPIRDSTVWTDIAVNLDPPPGPGQPPVVHGSKGALYLGTVGKPDDSNVDTLWWFDGTSKWFKTGLRTDTTGVPAPVISIVCDPAFHEEVYVGTTVGVWKGVRTQVGNADPAWTWHKRLNGLPEAAVEDLAIFSDDGLRLLRAAIASRGVWELRLDVTDVQDLTYVRAHDDDLRYRPPVSTQRNGVTPRSWHGSPDVRPRTASAALTVPTSLPWTRSFFDLDNDGLRRFQAALRSRTADARVRPTGEWDLHFNEVLRDLGAPLLPSPPAAANVVSIDAAFWTLSMVPPHATMEPWGKDVLTEADLHEFTPSLTEGPLGETSCKLPPSPAKIDIVIHYRGLDSIDGASVRVTLLRWTDPKTKNKAKPKNPASWFTDPIPWAEAVNEVLNLDAGSTTKTVDAGWSFVGTTNATRRLTLNGQTLDPLRPGIATFDLNLSGLKKNTVMLLVAVIRSSTNPINLESKTLEELVMKNSNVAVRSVLVT